MSRKLFTAAIEEILKMRGISEGINVHGEHLTNLSQMILFYSTPPPPPSKKKKKKNRKTYKQVKLKMSDSGLKYTKERQSTLRTIQTVTIH